MDKDTRISDIAAECVARGEMCALQVGRQEEDGPATFLVLIAMGTDAEFFDHLLTRTLAAVKSTSPEVATLAARGLADPASLTEAEIRAVCGSALGQVEKEEEE